jgi:glycosyltransferase involved in cell wall biosynthesis
LQVNALIISNNPNRASFRQRIGAYLDILRTNGIDCEVAKLPGKLFARWKLFRQTRKFDGVFLHRKCLNFFDAFALRKYAKKIIYDFDDALMYSVRHPERDSRSHFTRFRRTAKPADMVTAGNAYLAEHARKFNRYVHVLPTGLDMKAYATETKPENNGKIRLVWIGSPSTLDYLAAIKPALEELGLRFDNVILRIICDKFFELKNMRVEKHPWSLEKEAMDLLSSDIGISPLPDDRFTRGKCEFKILQYASAGLPVIASPVGVNAEYVRDGVTGFLAANNRQWVEKLACLIENQQLRKRMGQENLIHAESFDIHVIGKQLADLVVRCLRTTTTTSAI